MAAKAQRRRCFLFVDATASTVILWLCMTLHPQIHLLHGVRSAHGADGDSKGHWRCWCSLGPFLTVLLFLIIFSFNRRQIFDSLLFEILISESVPRVDVLGLGSKVGVLPLLCYCL
ncbi:hypothetical protein ACFX2B_044237 [Malus domestica]